MAVERRTNKMHIDKNEHGQAWSTRAIHISFSSFYLDKKLSYTEKSKYKLLSSTFPLSSN